MRQFSASPVEMLSCLWRNRTLIKALTRREIIGRYRGSVMGIMWSLFNPLFMLLVYTFVFSEVFKIRWGVGGDSKTEFASALFIGLIFFNLLSDCVSRAPSLICSNVNYVKKVVFPLEILPFVVLGSALFHGALGFGVWLVAYIFAGGGLHISMLYLPLVVLPFIFIVMGVSWALASLGVFLRDVSQFIGPLTTILMFLSPIFYPLSALSEFGSKLLYLNPLSPVIEQSRIILIIGDAPDFIILGCYWGAASITAWLGFAWFQKTRKGFSDVL